METACDQLAWDTDLKRLTIAAAIGDSFRLLGEQTRENPVSKAITHNLISRRLFVTGAAAAVPLLHTSSFAGPSQAQSVGLDLLREPEAVRAFVGGATDSGASLARSGNRWSGAGVDLAYAIEGERGSLVLHAPGKSVRRLHLRWRSRLSKRLLVLGDAWERSYGDLAWMPLQPERPLPWYCLLHNGESTFGMGVATGASAFAFWQVDSLGVSLWLDLRNGGNGVLLEARTLAVASIVTHQSEAGESSFQTAQKLCKKMAPDAVTAKRRGKHHPGALFGSNDWYYAYGNNKPENILRDADLMGELAPDGPIRPFTVIDDGYQDKSRFPDLHELAESIRRKNVNPGIWVRPLRAPLFSRKSWLLPASRYGRRQERANELVFDPTIPEARDAALRTVHEARSWGFELIKHDFTTYELFGQWGSEMGPSPTVDGWSFNDRSKTNAEIVKELYKDIRAGAGEDSIVLGCNTVGHLAAGIFDAQRVGDDVSGHDWERTRRMGVNTLAFRLPQNGIFFAADPDCIPITDDIPWNHTEQWLRAVAGSGAVLFISAGSAKVGSAQKQAIRAAFNQRVSAERHSEPADWMTTRTPEDWVVRSSHHHYKWVLPEGSDPFCT